MAICEVARFYGWTHWEILNLPEDVFNIYLEAINILSAKEALLNLKISCAPNMKKANLDKLHRSLQKERMNYDMPEKYLTNEDMARLLNE